MDEIEKWREKLARNIALRNPNLSVRELNIAVQRTIDRIIFLRICEDRGIEKYGRLRNIAQNEKIYKNLTKSFKEADDKYNSGLFHFKKERDRETYPDELTLGLEIDDRVLKNIFRRLYYPNSPYEFSVISTEILGNIYEQFLGRIIRLTKEHRAKVEEKPEVKKAGGVFYTPEYIVNYIVENTVGKLCNGKTPNKVSKLKILDPACGSGSFLIGAYSYLLKWHLDYYTNLKDKSRYKDRIYKNENNEWNLTIQEKKRILLNNIFGVDIDNQAVEVTKLSLLLKVLEGEKKDRFEKQQKLWQERALPDLGNNIKCGNSLISTDFFQNGIQKSLYGEKLLYSINPFKWNLEFENIIKKGGFDAIIGNPPYVLIGSDREEEHKYFTSGKYKLTSYKINTYILFLEKGLKLLRKNGYVGYIIPKSLVFNTYFDETRRQLMSNYEIPQIVEIADKIFKNAEVGDSILFFACRTKNPQNNSLEYLKVTNIFPKMDVIEKIKCNQEKLLSRSDAPFYLKDLTFTSNTKKFSEIANISNGLNPGNIRHILFSDKKETQNHKKLILGRDIQNYSLHWSGVWVNYDQNLKNKVKITDIKSKKGMTPQKKIDFALRKPEIYKPNKLLIRKTSDHIIAAYDDYGYYFDSLSYGVHLKKGEKLSLFYLLGVLNSNLMDYIHEEIARNKGKVYAKVLAVNLKKLPIRTIDFSNEKEKILHDKLVKLVENMVHLKNQLFELNVEADINIIQRQIDNLDNQINKLVYELYDLTEDTIKSIEGKND